MISTSNVLRLLLLLLVAAPASPGAQDLRHGRVVLDTVYGRSLEGNRTDERLERTVAVYLPPSYDEDPGRRYPVVHFLHGTGGDHRQWVGTGPFRGPWCNLQDVMDRGIAAGTLREMILVAVDESTRAGGSWYTNSELTGAWEDFTVSDLVEEVDAGYRTLASAESRGLAGHSMGGFGALKLGMRHPDVFGLVYSMSAAMLGWATDNTEENEAYVAALDVTPGETGTGFWPVNIVCVGQAFSPNPERERLLCDLPFELRDGRLQRAEPAYSLWQAEMPLYLVERYREELLGLRGLRFDCGRYDGFTHVPLTNRALSHRLEELGVPHLFEEYNGTHSDRIWGEEGRVAATVLPWFSRRLVFETAR